MTAEQFYNFHRSQLCTALNIDASPESVEILDDEMHDSDKQVIMSKILIDIQNLLKK